MALSLLQSTEIFEHCRRNQPEKHLIYLVAPHFDTSHEIISEVERYGYTVQAFFSVEKMEEALVGKLPKVIIIDSGFLTVNTPSGKSVEQLRMGHKKLPPLVFISREKDFETHLMAVRAGGRAYLTKPLDIIQLIDSLNQLTWAQVSTPYRILIVEDDTAQGTFFSLVLQKAGIITELVSDPLAVMLHLDDFKPDLVLMDVHMNGCNGLELAAVIRQHHSYLDIPIVFLSANNDLGRQLAAMHLGGDDFLTKPILPEHLVSAVCARAERSRILRAFSEELEVRVIARTTALQQATEQLMGETVHRKQVQEELRISSQYTINILESITDGFLTIDHYGNFTYINSQAEQLLQRKRENLLGRDMKVEFPSSAGFTLFDQLPTQLKGQTTFEFEDYYAPGQIWFEVRTYPYQDGLSIFFHDITSRKQAEINMWEALQKEKELNELKSRFVTTTSHEFRTPLSTILATVELLECYNDRWTEEKKHTFFQRIHTAIERMTGLLDDVLLISKADAGRLEFKPTSLELVGFCRELTEELQLGLDSNHSINFASPVGNIIGTFDEKLLRHILVNLLSNAVKYSPKSGIIQFKFACESDKVVFTVQDEGIGIPVEDQVHLFDVFHRAKNVGSIPGTGLGLTIVKRGVDLHLGKVEVVSEVGRGTTFTVTLPFK